MSEQLTGPADTNDPTVVVSTANIAPTRADLMTGTRPGGVVVEPVEQPPRDDSDDRWETYEVEGPDGQLRTVRRNLETGVSEVIG